ncbi:MAG: CapA family protein [Anaerolineaceae bacterium]|nr:CapA family protein [Anaerolineaceae bacterium]
MNFKKHFLGLVASPFLVFLFLLQACAGLPLGRQNALPLSGSEAPGTVSQASPSALPVEPSPSPAPTAAVLPVPTLPPPCLSLAKDLPADILYVLKEFAGQWPCLSDLQKRVNIGFSQSSSLADWVYALVAPFNTVNDEFSTAEFKEYWEGITEKPFKQLAMSASTKAALVSLFGELKGVVNVQAEGALLDYAWQTPNTWAVVPFEALEPRWKVISLDGHSPLHKDFEPEHYPLLAHIGIEGEGAHPAFLAELQKILPHTNRDPQKLSTVILTGTTALVRATAYAMEKEGVDKPAAIIGPILRAADITHVSNEVSYAEDCPYPNPVTQSMRFCSALSYNKVLEDIGTDVVDLTGDHFVDWGYDAARATVDLYHSLGWQTYGGGVDLKNAQKPALFEVNGNKITFTGCNAKHAGYNVATENEPGALDCDLDFLHQQIRELKAQGYVVITSFQHYEDYGWFPDTALAYDMQQAALAGADIVSGSQAHRPQIYAFYGPEKNHFVHFGLGNLFFDQILLGNDCDKGFVDRHVIYNGKYISTEMLTIILPDFLQPTWMNEQERSLFLGTLHKYSDIFSAPEGE